MTAPAWMCKVLAISGSSHDGWYIGCIGGRAVRKMMNGGSVGVERSVIVVEVHVV